MSYQPKDHSAGVNREIAVRVTDKALEHFPTVIIGFQSVVILILVSVVFILAIK